MKTPQQKKADSYEHDRRNSYGESDKGSRKSIPRNKAITRRNARRVAKQKTNLDVDEDDIGVAHPGKRPFEKFPDMPLSEFLDFQKTKRAKLAGSKKVRLEENSRARREHEESMRMEQEEKKQSAREREEKIRWEKAEKKRRREAHD